MLDAIYVGAVRIFFILHLSDFFFHLCFKDFCKLFLLISALQINLKLEQLLWHNFVRLMGINRHLNGKIIFLVNVLDKHRNTILATFLGLQENPRFFDRQLYLDFMLWHVFWGELYGVQKRLGIFFTT